MCKLGYFVSACVLLAGSVADGGIFQRSTRSSCCHVVQQQQVVSYYQKVVAQQVVVAVPVVSRAVPVQMYGVNHWYSVENAYQQQSAMRNIVREELRNYTGGPQVGQQSQAAYQAGLPAPQTSAGPGGSVVAPQQQLLLDDVTPQDIQQQVIAAFSGKANCLNCHGANPTLGGNFRLVTADSSGRWQLLKISSDKRWKAYGMAAVGAMPPAAANDADKAMEAVHLPNLLRWAAIK